MTSSGTRIEKPLISTLFNTPKALKRLNINFEILLDYSRNILSTEARKIGPLPLFFGS